MSRGFPVVQALKVGLARILFRRHGQRHPLRLGIEGVERENTNLVKGRIDDITDKCFHGEILPCAPKMQEQRTQQDMFPALQRVPFISIRASRLVVVEFTRLLRVSVSFNISSAGARKLLSTETGTPALLPGV